MIEGLIFLVVLLGVSLVSLYLRVREVDRINKALEDELTEMLLKEFEEVPPDER